MSLGWHFWSNGLGTRWVRVALVPVALLALLSARSLAPAFPQAPSIHAAVSGVSHHDQRPRFDNDGRQCCPPNDTVMLSPPEPTRASMTLATALAIPFPTEGAHYNRPPPIR